MESPRSKMARILRVLEYEPTIKPEPSLKDEPFVKEEHSPKFEFPPCLIRGDSDDPFTMMRSTGPPDPGPPGPLNPPPGPTAPFEDLDTNIPAMLSPTVVKIGSFATTGGLAPFPNGLPGCHESLASVKLPLSLRPPFEDFDNRVSRLLGVSDYTLNGPLNWQKCGTSDPEGYLWSLRATEIGGQRVENRGDGEVTRMGAGESYRPAARARSPASSPRASTFRPDRDRSPRRERPRTPISDSYHPRARSPLRRRSRSPLPYRRERSPLRENSYRGRPRSPPRARSPLRVRSPPRARSPPRRFSPRRNDDRRERPRSPRRDERRRSRSPYDRDRPLPSRARSPVPARRFSPPNGPRGSYRRSISPPRRDDKTYNGPIQAGGRRPLSPSPVVRDPERSSGVTSSSTSRRSSPPIHPSRMPLTHSSTRELPRARSPPSRARSPAPRARSPPPASRDRSPPTQSASNQKDTVYSARSTPRDRSPARLLAPRSPPKGPAAFRAPTGPSSSRHFPSVSPAPSSSTPVSAHSRPENTGPVVPPAGPRGYNPSARGTFSSRGGRGSSGSDRQSRPDTANWASAPPSRPVEAAPKPTPRPAPAATPSAPSVPSSSAVPTGPATIPTGPRAGPAMPSRSALQHSSNVYSSRPSQPITPSGLRPHPAMANMPQIIPSGRIDPTATGIPAEMATRLARRKEEEEVLREELKVKEERLRQNLKVWDRLSRESASMSLKTELSERHVRQLAGEGVGGAAF